MNLTAIDGVSEDEAEVLRENHIEYLEDLAGTRCLRVEDMGLSSELVAEALVEVGYGATFIDKDEIGYECQFCGKEFAGVQGRGHDRHVKHDCERSPGAGDNQFEEEVV